MESTNEFVVLIAFSTNECSGEPLQIHRLTRVPTARIPKEWMYKDPEGYFNMVVQSRLLRTCDKNQNHVLAQFVFILHRDVWTCLGEMVLIASEITLVAYSRNSVYHVGQDIY